MHLTSTLRYNRCADVPISDFFQYFYKSMSDGWTNGPRDRWTNRRKDTPSYRDARTHLKCNRVTVGHAFVKMSKKVENGHVGASVVPQGTCCISLSWVILFVALHYTSTTKTSFTTTTTTTTTTKTTTTCFLSHVFLHESYMSLPFPSPFNSPFNWTPEERLSSWRGCWDADLDFPTLNWDIFGTTQATTF